MGFRDQNLTPHSWRHSTLLAERPEGRDKLRRQRHREAGGRGCKAWSGGGAVPSGLVSAIAAAFELEIKFLLSVGT